VKKKANPLSTAKTTGFRSYLEKNNRLPLTNAKQRHLSFPTGTAIPPFGVLRFFVPAGQDTEYMGWFPFQVIREHGALVTDWGMRQPIYPLSIPMERVSLWAIKLNF